MNNMYFFLFKYKASNNKSFGNLSYLLFIIILFLHSCEKLLVYVL